MTRSTTPPRSPHGATVSPAPIRGPAAGRSRCVRGWLLLLLLALGAAPAGLAAHDDLRSAVPGEGDTLHAAPDTLRLTFTRPQNLELASITLLGPTGEVSLGELIAHPDSGAVTLVPVLGRMAAGEHRVRWRIVGQDGHPVSGEYRFVVTGGGEAPDGAGRDTSEAGGPGRSEDPAPGLTGAGTDERSRYGVGSVSYVVVRWLGFVALLGVVGAASWGLLVAPLARRRDPAVDVDRCRRRAAGVGAWAAGLLLAAGGARLWAQVRAVGGPEAPLEASVVESLLSSTSWGAGWWIQLAGTLVALTGFAWGRRRSGLFPWALAGTAAVVLAMTPALSGHAVAVQGPRALAILADGAHVLAAGGWMGGLFLLLWAAVPAARDERGGEARKPLAPLAESFSVTALGFATLLVLTGVFTAWLHLESLEDLWSSGYGRLLGLKLLILVPLLATGAYNWLRVRPALSRRERGVRALRRTGWSEVLLGVVVLLVTAVLVATPPPETAPPESSSALPTAPAAAAADGGETRP